MGNGFDLKGCRTSWFEEYISSIYGHLVDEDIDRLLTNAEGMRRINDSFDDEFDEVFKNIYWIYKSLSWHIANTGLESYVAIRYLQDVRDRLVKKGFSDRTTTYIDHLIKQIAIDFGEKFKESKNG